MCSTLKLLPLLTLITSLRTNWSVLQTFFLVLRVHNFDEFVDVSCLMLLLKYLHDYKHGKIKDVKVGTIGRPATEGNIPTSILRKTIKLNNIHKFSIFVLDVGCSIVLLDSDISWAPIWPLSNNGRDYILNNPYTRLFFVDINCFCFIVPPGQLMELRRTALISTKG